MALLLASSLLHLNVQTAERCITLRRELERRIEVKLKFERTTQWLSRREPTSSSSGAEEPLTADAPRWRRHGRVEPYDAGRLTAPTLHARPRGHASVASAAPERYAHT